MKVVREYPGSHHYIESYTKTDMYCPLCGKQEIWTEDGPGDYYAGSDYICVACGAWHTLDDSHVPHKPEHYQVRIVAQLQSGIMDPITTKKGT